MADRMSDLPQCPYYLKTHPFKAILTKHPFHLTCISQLFALRGNGIVQQSQHLRDLVTNLESRFDEIRKKHTVL